MDERVLVPTPDGWALGVRVIPAVGPRRGVALLLHAMMVDGRTFLMAGEDGLAGTLAAHGWEAWVADFRGHATSGPTPVEGGSWTYEDLVALDVPALVAAARARGAGPVVLLGHSLGGHVSAAAIGARRAEVDALVLLAANIWRPSLEPSRRLRVVKGATIRAFAATAGLVGRYPARLLGHGPADEAAPYCADLARFWTTDAWTPRGGAVDWTTGLARVACPTLQVHATGDRLLGAQAGARAWAAPIPRLESWVVGGGACGVAADPTHVGLVTSSACLPVHHAIAGWLGRVVTPG